VAQPKIWRKMAFPTIVRCWRARTLMLWRSVRVLPLRPTRAALRLVSMSSRNGRWGDTAEAERSPLWHGKACRPVACKRAPRQQCCTKELIDTGYVGDVLSRHMSLLRDGVAAHVRWTWAR
jgi:hypothetical protein